ncbi:MAG: peptide deformylase, partial [Bacteroidota bacterium]
VVMINPEVLLESDEKVIYEEGCLSLPTLKADVERAEIIKIRFIDTDEKEKEIEADDFFARVILHEYDHLNGKMIPDRVAASVKKKLQSDLNKILSREVEIDYEITEK